LPLASAGRIAPGLFQSQIERRFRGRTRSDVVHFSLAASGTSHEPLYVTTTCVISDIARSRDYGKLATPEPFGSVQNPLGVYRLPQDFTHRRSQPLPDDAFAGFGSVRLSLALARSRRIALHPRGLLSAVVNRDAIPFVGFRRCTSTANSGLLATPILQGRTVPPGRLRSSTGFPYEPASIRLRRTPPTSVLPDCSGTFSVTGWAHLIVQVRTPDSSRCVVFQPHGSWTIRMSLSTLVNSADIAQRRVYGLFATPDMFGPNQSPLSAVHLPQALVSVVAASLPTLPFR
jgi:hypothetical protein